MQGVRGTVLVGSSHGDGLFTDSPDRFVNPWRTSSRSGSIPDLNIIQVSGLDGYSACRGLEDSSAGRVTPNINM